MGAHFPTNAVLLEVNSIQCQGGKCLNLKRNQKKLYQEKETGMENKFPEYFSVNKPVESLLLEYAESHGNWCIFFCPNSFLASPPLAGWTASATGEVVPSRIHATAGFRRCTPRSDRRGCTGRWPWVACPLSSAAAAPSAWRSGAGSSDRRSERAAWGQCWRTPRARSVTPGCSAPRTWPGAPSGERREVVTLQGSQNLSQDPTASFKRPYHSLPIPAGLDQWLSTLVAHWNHLANLFLRCQHSDPISDQLN